MLFGAAVNIVAFHVPLLDCRLCILGKRASGVSTAGPRFADGVKPVAGEATRKWGLHHGSHQPYKRIWSKLLMEDGVLDRAVQDSWRKK